jgi:hypothetical protein
MRLVVLAVLLWMAHADPSSSSASAPASGAAGATSAAAPATTAAAVVAATAPATTPAPFCLQCGFDFGSILPGVDNQTAGAVLVAIVVVVIAFLACICACCLHNSCYSTSDYQRVGSRQPSETV